MELEFRSAQFEDLENLVSLLANDPLGKKREDTTVPINNAYLSAFKAITCDPNNELLVVELQGR